MSDLRVGLIGCGRHGERYLRHLAQGDVDGMRAVQVWRRDRDAADRLASTYEVSAVSNLDAMMDPSRLDAVLILTPPGDHADLIARAVDAGLGVLVEKPAIAQWDDRAQLEAIDASRVMVAQTLRFSATLRRMRQLLPTVGSAHRIRLAQRLEPSDLAWQRDRAVAGGGSVLLTGVHLFDLLRWTVGRTPDTVGCRTYALAGHPLENLFDAAFDYEDLPLLAATEVCKFSQSRSGLMEIIGDEGELHVDYLRGTVDFRRGTATERLAEVEEVPTIPIALGFFGAMLRGEIPSPVTLQDGLETVRMAEACYRSHASGQRVRLDSIQ